MIECNIYKNTNADSKYYGKWYPRNEPKGIVDLDGLAQHMAEHNTPFSKGVNAVISHARALLACYQRDARICCARAIAACGEQFVKSKLIRKIREIRFNSLF